MTLHFTSGTNTAANASAYQVTGGEWASGTIQWSNKPAANTLLQSNISHNNVTGYVFSCLAAVQHWYDGDTTGQNENYGIMLRYYNESTADYNAVYSADYSDATKRPSLTISYTAPNDEISVLEGLIKQLPLPDTTETITWTSSNTAVATVNSAGKVTGVKAGKVTITASAGGTELHTYTVYVRIDDGVYRIENQNVNIFLAANSGALENALTKMQASTTDELPMLRQLWRVTYLSAGYYVIRPMHNQNMALHSKYGISDVTTIGSNNTLGGVPAENRWTIEYLDDGYLIECQGDSGRALRCNGVYPGANIYTAAYNASIASYKWNFEDAPYISPRVVMLDTQTGESIAYKTFWLNPGEKADLHMTASIVCTNINNQDVACRSDSESVTFDPITSVITAVTPGGSAAIIAEYFYNGSTYAVRCYAYVKPCLDGVYFVRCCAYDRYIQVDNRDASNDFSTSGAKIEQWAYHGTDFQKWTITYRGNGYYSIINLESGMALTVPAGETGSEGVYIGQETYTGNDRQLWKITATNKGKYKIKAKSAEGMSKDLVLTVGHGSFNNSNAVYLEQYQYTDDAFYNDEWFICTPVDIGMSTDDYSGNEERKRGSYTYATTFYDGLAYPSDIGPFSLTYHYNKDTVHTASKEDFAENGAISDDIDFMIYMGHGHDAEVPRDDLNPNKLWGNHIQYSHSTDGYNEYTDVCVSDQYTQAEKDNFCLYTSEVKFGSNTSDLRWVWMYTCNFLNSEEDCEEYKEKVPIDGNGYVTNADLFEMMTGVHIVLGYATQSYLCNVNARLFAQYLCSGETIIDAFFKAGVDGEGVGKANGGTDDLHIQKVMYIPQAMNETIYSPQIHYEYDTADVWTITHNIQEQYS